MNMDYSYHYQKWHSDTPEHRAAMSAYYRRFLTSELPTDKAAPILDVGCGAGYALLTARDLGFSKLIGVDCDAGQVASCKAKGLDEVTLSENTVGFLKSRAGFFQTLLALDLIEHIPHCEQLEFVRALAEALLPGGKLICTVPNANSALAGRYRYIDWTHRTSFTEHSLDFLLFNGGFREIKISEVEYLQRPNNIWLPVSGARHWWAFRFFRFLRRLEMMAELGPQQGRTIPLSLNLLAIAHKP